MPIKNGIHDIVMFKIYRIGIFVYFLLNNFECVKIKKHKENQNLSWITFAANIPYLNIQLSIHFTANKNTHAIGKYCIRLHINWPKTDAFFSYTVRVGVFNLTTYLNKLLGIFRVRLYVDDCK